MFSLLALTNSSFRKIRDNIKKKIELKNKTFDTCPVFQNVIANKIKANVNENIFNLLNVVDIISNYFSSFHLLLESPYTPLSLLSPFSVCV